MKLDDQLSVNPVVLILHAEPLISMMIEELLIEVGVATIHIARDNDEVGKILSARHIDVAILGICFDSSEIFQAAEMLNSGHIPFIVYGSLGSLPKHARLNMAPAVPALTGVEELLGALAIVGIAVKPVAMKPVEKARISDRHSAIDQA